MCGKDGTMPLELLNVLITKTISEERKFSLLGYEIMLRQMKAEDHLESFEIYGFDSSI